MPIKAHLIDCEITLTENDIFIFGEISKLTLEALLIKEFAPVLKTKMSKGVE